MTEQDHKLGEVLRAAREAKEIDLLRVERDTKIRERYLSALERGEYRELPGAVYTKGFLRNYGAYLGLDPEYLIDLYRLETSALSAERPIRPSPPRPITVRRRRTFVVTPGAVAAAILTILVGAFVAWLGYEFVNFARTPELRIVEPAGDVSAHTESTIIIRGVTAPDAVITVSGLPENPSTTADADGNFEMTLGLLPGSNEIHLVAQDPVTNRKSEEFIRRVNVVSEVEPSPSVGGVAVSLDQPAADASVTGAVAVSGTATPGERLDLSAVLITVPTPTFTVADAAGAAVKITPATPSAPAPSSITADAAGAFSGSLSLLAGIWDVVVTPTSTEPHHAASHGGSRRRPHRHARPVRWGLVPRGRAGWRAGRGRLRHHQQRRRARQPERALDDPHPRRQRRSRPPLDQRHRPRRDGRERRRHRVAHHAIRRLRRR